LVKDDGARGVRARVEKARGDKARGDKARSGVCAIHQTILPTYDS